MWTKISVIVVEMEQSADTLLDFIVVLSGKGANFNTPATTYTKIITCDQQDVFNWIPILCFVCLTFHQDLRHERFN